MIRKDTVIWIETTSRIKKVRGQAGGQEGRKQRGQGRKEGNGGTDRKKEKEDRQRRKDGRNQTSIRISFLMFLVFEQPLMACG